MSAPTARPGDLPADEPSASPLQHDFRVMDPEPPQVLVTGPALARSIVDMLDLLGCTALVAGNDGEALALCRTPGVAAIVLEAESGEAANSLPEFLGQLRDSAPGVPAVVLSRDARPSAVVELMKLGAAHVIADASGPEVRAALRDALQRRKASRELARLRLQLQAGADLIFGRSEPMRAVRAALERVSDDDEAVLLVGERGTGKRLLARTICALSARSDRPFISVTCAGVPSLDCELFGIERGGFPWAVRPRPGKLEFANQGTLFLDEVAEAPLKTQERLLSVMRDGVVARGGRTGQPVDVRMISATSRDLHREVAAGAFLEDLYDRLSAVSVRLPPLRERPEDIPALAEHFLKKHSVRHHRLFPEISASAMRLLQGHHWPGNVRELEALIERAVIAGSELPLRQGIRATAVQRRPQASTAPSRATPSVESPIAEVSLSGDGSDRRPVSCSIKEIARRAARQAERELIWKMLQRTRWNRKEAAEILGISYKALLYKIRENGLDKPPSPGEAPLPT
jgi:two-component system, NtrC family, response regulator AtoC